MSAVYRSFFDYDEEKQMDNRSRDWEGDDDDDDDSDFAIDNTAVDYSKVRASKVSL